MNTTKSGRRAERLVADYFETRGFHIRERNWRRRDVEIDLVAQKSRKLYFIEVKYRNGNNPQQALESITWNKLRQLQHGARAYVAELPRPLPYQILAVAVSGQPPTVRSIRNVSYLV